MYGLCSTAAEISDESAVNLLLLIVGLIFERQNVLENLTFRSAFRSKLHLFQTALYFPQVFGSYSLMMVAMTYNVPLVLAMIAGRVLAYFLLAPLTNSDISDDEEEIADCCG